MYVRLRVSRPFGDGAPDFCRHRLGHWVKPMSVLRTGMLNIFPIYFQSFKAKVKAISLHGHLVSVRMLGDVELFHVFHKLINVVC